MNLPTQPYKGARDFYPEDKQIQNYMFETMKKVAARYGYLEYDAPILEPLDLYRAKTGEEIVNEQTYAFTDRGGREVAIRPEMTPTVSRMVAARRQELPYPLRWFSIPNLWRYERPQRGRLREHWQLNVDLFGEEGLAAEHEVIMVANDILKSYGANQKMFEIKLNSRKLVDLLFEEYLGLNGDKKHQLIKLLDRVGKIDQAAMTAQMDQILADSPEGTADKVLNLLKVKELKALPDDYANSEPARDLKELISLLENSHVTNARFDMTLMRGFDYYTDIVFEVFDTHPENNRSMFGGGRYDGLVGLFGVDPVPTVGFGMGDLTLQNFLVIHNLLPKLTTPIDLLLVLVGDVYGAASKLASELRDMDINVSVDASDRKLDKKLKSADKQGIRHVLFVGERELQDESYPLKDLVTGKEEKHSAERIVSIIKDYRS